MNGDLVTVLREQDLMWQLRFEGSQRPQLRQLWSPEEESYWDGPVGIEDRRWKFSKLALKEWLRRW